MSRIQWYRRWLYGVLAVSLCLIGFYYYEKICEGIPDHITITAGNVQGTTADKLFRQEVVQASSVSQLRLPEQAVHIEVDDSDGFINQDIGTYTVQCKLLGVLNLKSVQVDIVEQQEVYPCGFPVGIYVETEGIMVIGSGGVTGMDGMNYEPAKNIIQSGDYITAINGKQVTTKEAFIQIVNEEGGNPVVLDIRRKGENTRVKITPVQTGREEYRIGVWIRDNTQGVGMLTFITRDGKFGALGHGITDIDTGLLMTINKGRLLDTEIVSVVKGRDGVPGELVGMIDYRPECNIGTVSNNTRKGIFGNIDENVLGNLTTESMPIGWKQEIQTGPAQIRTCVDGEMKDYDIEILDIQYNSEEENKSFLIEITDAELLEKTGGIVQGMSGSPVIQNGKLVGAVTHVLVQDSSKGYGIFIEEMLKECQ